MFETFYINVAKIKDNMDYQYTFTEDWFSGNIPIWDSLLTKFKNTSITALEIGSFQGRSSVWLLTNVLTHPESRLVCVDTFEGSPEHNQSHTNGLFDIFLHNITPFRERVIIHKGKSQSILRTLPETCYDFIYIDGDHRAMSVLEDAVLSFRLLNVGGIIIFDDYLWKGLPRHIDTPKPAIDSFLSIYSDYIKILHSGYQVAITKTRHL